MTHEHDDHQGHEHEHRDDDYAAWLAVKRRRKDDAFRTSIWSPIPAAGRAVFPGLPYFAVDPGLRFEGLTLEPFAGGEPTEFEIPTSDGQLRPAHRIGSLSFDVAGTACTLTAYRLEGAQSGPLFIPVLDATSGRETYGAGRYLDVDEEPDGTYTLDFNLAYHPYCVYAEAFSCPLTPAENRLPVRIEAGERLADPS